MSQNTNESHLTGLTDQEVIASREKNWSKPINSSQTSFHMETLFGEISGSCYPSIISCSSFFTYHFNY